MNDLPGMLGLAIGVHEQRWPHTIDAQEWARQWASFPWWKRVAFALDEGMMLGWFANAIMAGYDTAQARAQTPGEQK